jgi:hypothetical protein
MPQGISTIRGKMLVYQREAQDHALAVGTPEWYAWLATASTFAFTNSLPNTFSKQTGKLL